MRSLWQKYNLYFSSAAPQGLACRVSVLESALHGAIQVNSCKEAPIPSNKFQSGIPFLSILQDGSGSPKQLYKNFRLTTFSEALPPLFKYPTPLYLLITSSRELCETSSQPLGWQFRVLPLLCFL